MRRCKLVSKSAPEKIRTYLHTNNYFDVYIFLISSSDNLRNRAILLSKNLREFEGKLKETVGKVSAKPDEIVPESLEISTLFKSVHYNELEVIQRINILIELLAIYYRTIRTNLRELPKVIGRTDFRPRELYREFEYFNNQKLHDVWTNFKYPDVSHFNELSAEEQNTLQELLEQSAQNILDAFKWIFQFQKNFRTVYNKYKHSLSEFTGVFGIDRTRKLVQTHIYLRHKKNNRFYTYMIPASFDEVKYFNEVGARVYKLLRVLIDNTLLSLVNEEKDFIPRTLFIEKRDEGKFKEIANKIQSCIMPEFTSKMKVNLPDQENLEKINKILREHHIYQMKKDILDTESLLEQGVTISRS